MQIDEKPPERAAVPGRGLVPDEALVAFENLARGGIEAQDGAEVVRRPGPGVLGLRVEEGVDVPPLAGPDGYVVEVGRIDLGRRGPDPSVDRHFQRVGRADAARRPAADLAAEDRRRPGRDHRVEQQSQGDPRPSVNGGQPPQLRL